jgi:hypothetical protein
MHHQFGENIASSSEYCKTFTRFYYFLATFFLRYVINFFTAIWSLVRGVNTLIFFKSCLCIFLEVEF